MTRPRKPWADRTTVALCAFARVTGPLCGPGGCGVGHYAVRLAPPVCAEHADDAGRVSATILAHGRPVRRPAVRYAIARAFGLDVREDYAGGCVAELVDVRPVVQWPRSESSGLLEAWARLPMPGVMEVMQAVLGPVRLDALAHESMVSASYTGPARRTIVAADTVRAIADALDTVRPVQVSLGGVVLLECSGGPWEPAAYRWPLHFTGWSHVPRGSVEDCTVLAALAVGVALWSRLPTADEVAAWMDGDESAGEEVG